MPKDKNDRELARTSRGKNIVVEAGAGTGKTTLLIDRLCFLMLACGVKPEHMAVMTFTEKAAAEIKTRLMQKMSAVISELSSARETEYSDILKTALAASSYDDVLARARAAYSTLDRCSLSTIHSFCSYILKKFPLEAGLSPSLTIDTGKGERELFNRRWHAFLNEELGENAPRAARWESALKEVSLDEIYEFAFTLSSSKLEGFTPGRHKEILAQACFENAASAEEMSEIFLDGKKPRAVERALAASAKVLRVAADCLVKENFDCEVQEEIQKTDSRPANWDEQSFLAAKQIINFAHAMRPAAQKFMLDLTALLAPFAAALRADLEARGIVSFDDLLIKTRNLLKNNLSVRNKLKKEFSFICVDEFQDTDPVQGEMLLYLAEAENGASSSWENVILEPGKLFVVGDPKQSIYRFRGADISAYQFFTNQILKQGGIKCYLQTNFRSTKKIIDFVNAVASKIIKEERGFQSAYAPIFHSAQKENEAEVEIHFIDGGEARPSARALRQNQAEFCAEWIAKNIEENKFSARDAAILLRTSTDFNIFTEALKRHDVKFNIERDDYFYSAPEINDIINLLTLLDNPSDKPALLGVLRSPLAAFTDAEILLFSRRNLLDLNATIPPQKEFERLKTFYAELRNLHALSGRLRLEELIAKILGETFFTEFCALSYDGENTVSNIAAFVNIVSARAADSPLSLRQFLTSFEEWKESGAAFSEAADAVTLMTVHASKGLEFPVVILADLSKSNSTVRKKNTHSYSWEYDMHGLRAGDYSSAEFAFLEARAALHAEAEEARLFYVAATRAREKLLLLSDLRTEVKSQNEYLFSAGFTPETGMAARVDYREPEEFIFKLKKPQIQAAAPEPQAKKWAEVHALRAENYRKIKEEKMFLTPSSLTEHGAPPDKKFAEGGSAAALGSLVHKALERMDFSAPPTQADINAAARFVPEITEEIKQEALQIFENLTLYKELSKYQIWEREMPFTFLHDGKIVSGVMDLVCERDGEIFIFDYKTDKTPRPQIYAPQLKMYALAARQIFKNKKIKCGIIFLRTSEIVLLEE